MTLNIELWGGGEKNEGAREKAIFFVKQERKAWKRGHTSRERISEVKN